MELNVAALCRRKISCSCGRIHYCPIDTVEVSSGALKMLPELIAPCKAILLVADQNTFAACGKAATALMGEKLQRTLIYQRTGMLVPNEKAVAELEAALSPDTDFVIGIGSGVINDLCKYVTFNRSMEYGIIASAPSMDGYASSGAAMIMGGMKITYATRPPKWILADVDVLRLAPLDMIRSGYGDIIGKYSSLNDWRLSALVNGEYLCPEVYQLVMDTTNEIRRCAARIVAREPEAIELLTKALILIGVTLSLVETTRPGSGSEHHLSHFFEIVGLIHDEPYFLHGTDVGYSTVITAALRERLCRIESPVPRPVPEESRRKAWERIYGDYAGEIAKIQQHFGFYDRDMAPLYSEKWPQILEILRECPSAAEVQAMLDEAGYEKGGFERLYGQQKIDDAILYAKDLKERYSVLWLWWTLFGGESNA